jgi:N-acylneuraminate cytidylyltransferase
MRRQPSPESGKKVLAIIPARGGSKGLPGKNIRLLAGKPLLGYSIGAARNSRHITKTVVSTDSAEIARVAEKCSAEVIIRPEEIARDTSPVLDTILNVMTVLDEREGFVPEIIVLLQPTSPLRTTEDIDAAIGIFLAGGFESVISVCETDHSPYWCFTIGEEKLRPLFNKKLATSRRQDLPKTYRPNGALFTSTPEFLKKNAGFMAKKTGPYVMPVDRSIDIDTLFDLQVAELLMAGAGPAKS